MTVDPGSWTNNPTGFSYQEQLCDDSGQNCADHGAAQSDPTFYVWEAARSLRVVVTATNGSGSSNATTAVKYVAPQQKGDGIFNGFGGHPVEGQAYTDEGGLASQDAWFGAQPFSFTFQWQRCDERSPNSGPNVLECAPITGANAISYVPQAADVGHILQLTVTATNAGGSGSQIGNPTYGVDAGTADLREDVGRRFDACARRRVSGGLACVHADAAGVGEQAVRVSARWWVGDCRCGR